MKVVLGVLIILLAACASQPPRDEQTEIKEPAQHSLLIWAEKLEAAGSFQQSASQIERLLRLEPRNARAWYQLARVHFRLAQYKQSRQFSLRSISYANNDRWLLKKNHELITQIDEATRL
ncbi:MAG: hypothetical protein OEW58_04920 [Gammaproteobacteria bacterium]|nr:hypothetical protein [Gammaproteobacteria bacterium]